MLVVRSGFRGCVPPDPGDEARMLPLNLHFFSVPPWRLQQTNTPLPRGWLPWFSVPPGRDGTGRMVPEFTSNAIGERLLAGE